MAELTMLARGDLTREAAAMLQAAGVPDARREASRLWRDLLAPADGHAGEGGGTLPARYLACARRRALGEPLAYVTGWTGFRHLVLGTDRRALIPRPETEGLIPLAMHKVPAGMVADIGTGTGAIALSLAHEGRYDRVIAIDCSSPALALAGENAARCGLPIRFLAGDLTAPLGDATVDLLVSNPPYLAAKEMDALDPSVRDWEPAMALDGGVDGLEPYRRLLADAPRVLRPGGWIALEIDARRPEETAALAVGTGWYDVTIHDDLFGRARYLLARREIMS
ncbi:MAG TPA: peptide chain release factor N(5)-glutamine methyltransferase [Gemmatimonadales bacterium]|nr:peptide chain release factor N(5)-glutamine methyltransferase [Gemmatimonadales bacterium]